MFSWYVFSLVVFSFVYLHVALYSVPSAVTVLIQNEKKQYHCLKFIIIIIPHYHHRCINWSKYLLYKHNSTVFCIYLSISGVSRCQKYKPKMKKRVLATYGCIQPWKKIKTFILKSECSIYRKFCRFCFVCLVNVSPKFQNGKKCICIFYKKNCKNNRNNVGRSWIQQIQQVHIHD